jgi:hypothetical protein
MFCVFGWKDLAAVADRRYMEIFLFWGGFRGFLVFISFGEKGLRGKTYRKFF